MRPKIEQLHKRLRDALGEEKVSASPHERLAYSHDLAAITGTMQTIARSLLFRMEPDLIVLPSGTEEVKLAVSHAARAGVPVVPRGGASWGHGSVTPVKGGVVLDLAYMNRVLDFDEKAGRVRVQAGVKCQHLQEFLERRGYTLPVCPLTAPYATVGGWIASSGLGVGSLKHGPITHHVTGMTVVTPEGEVVSSPPGSSFGSGCNLTWLYMCSEGTLGVITEVELSALPKAEQTVHAAYGFDSVKNAQAALSAVLKSEANPLHAEVLERNYAAMCRAMGQPVPEFPAVVNFTLDGDKPLVEKELKTLSEVCGKFVKEKKGFEIKELGPLLWEERYHTLRVRKLGPSLIWQELILPVAKLADFTEFCYGLADSYRLRVGLDAHVVAHNSAFVAPCFLADERRRSNFITSLPLVKDVVDEAVELGGRTYGVGLWDYFYLRYSKGFASMLLMKRIKEALDGARIMNPGKTCEVHPRLRIPGVNIEKHTSIPASSLVYNTVLWVSSFLVKIVRGAINALYWKK